MKNHLAKITLGAIAALFFISCEAETFEISGDNFYGTYERKFQQKIFTVTITPHDPFKNEILYTFNGVEFRPNSIVATLKSQSFAEFHATEITNLVDSTTTILKGDSWTDPFKGDSTLTTTVLASKRYDKDGNYLGDTGMTRFRWSKR